MKKNIKIKFLSIFLAFGLFVTLMPVGVLKADDNDFATQDQLEELERLKQLEKELAANQAKLDAEMDSIKQEVSNLQNKSLGLNSQLDKLSSDNKIAQEDYKRLKAELEAAETAMNKAIQEYEEAKKDVEDKEKEYEKRMIAMYKRSKQSPLEVLLDSEGITGFFTNLELLTVIAKSDIEILDQLTTARETSQMKKLKAEESKKMFDVFVEKKQKEINLLAQGIKSTENEISKVQEGILNRSSSLSELENTYTQNNKKQNNIASEQYRIQTEIKAQAEATRAAWAEATRAAQAEREKAAKESGNSGNYSTVQAPSSYGFISPVTGNPYITSYYGWRPWPLDPSAGRDFHTGLDLAGNFNDPILAVKDGIVSQVSYPFPNQNYGGYFTGQANYIIIDHQDGTYSAYWHLKSIKVSVGQRVSQGQRIGGMGSTGYSTGCHLHFEIRIPGHPNANLYDSVNPYPYLFG